MQKKNIKIMNNLEQRIQKYLQNIYKQSQGYKRRQIQQYEIEIFKRLPDKFEVIIPKKEHEYWMGRFEKVAAELPSPFSNRTSYVKQKNELLRALNKKYKLQRKGQGLAIYPTVFMICIGVSIGSSTGNLALWLPIGIALGAIVGYITDKRAKSKNLIL